MRCFPRRLRWPSFPGLAPPGAVAQQGEHLLCKQKVVGSIPISSTRFIRAALPPRRAFTNRIVPLQIKAGPAPNGQDSACNVELWELHSRGYFKRPEQSLNGNVSGDVV